jgi:membrane-associated phospholipid phosphatase
MIPPSLSTRALLPLFYVSGLLIMTAIVVIFTGTNAVLFVHLNDMFSQLPDPLWANLTFTADTLFVMALLGAIAARQHQLFAPALVLLLLGTLFVHSGKNLFDAARPAALLATDSFHLIGPKLKNHSFPSGHSFTIFAALTLIILYSKRCWMMPLLVWALLGAFSRVAVGAHWPLDVLVGSAGGILIAILTVWLQQRFSALQAPGWRYSSAVLLTIAAVYLPFFDSRYPGTQGLAIALALIALALLGRFFWWPLRNYNG